MRSNHIRTIRTVIRKFRTPAAIMSRLALDENPEEVGRSNGAQARQLLLDLVDDTDDSGLAELGNLIRKLSSDSRGLRIAARDERERPELRSEDNQDGEGLPTYLQSKPDGEDKRRMARDNPPPFAGRPTPGGTLEGEDRRRRGMAGDTIAFDELFPGAARVSRG